MTGSVAKFFARHRWKSLEFSNEAPIIRYDEPDGDNGRETSID